ncbi:MAG: ATP synthase F1 subunit epsilon [Acidimicrobiales bacterium]
MPTFPARLVTPEEVLLEEDVAAVILRTDVGDATFMPGHTRLIGAIVPGAVRFQREDGTEVRAAAHGGFVQVDAEHVVVLAPVAERAADIDVERARRALEAADERLTELGSPAGAGEAPGGEGERGTLDTRVIEAEGARLRAQVRLEVADAEHHAVQS